MAATRQLSHVYPLGSRLNERGRLEVGGCDAVELAREFGTPAYVVAEDDLRARARAFVEAARARHDGPPRCCSRPRRSPAPPSAGCSPRRGSGATSPRPASCTSRCAAASTPARIYLHGNAKARRRAARSRSTRGVGHVVDRRARRDRARSSARPPRAACASAVLLRVTPGVEPDTHARDLDRPARLEVRPRRSSRRAAAIERAARRPPSSSCEGLHMHIGSQIFELGLLPRGGRGARRARRLRRLRPRRRPRRRLHRAPTPPPAIEDYVEAAVGAVARACSARASACVLEPGRALVANATRDALHGRVGQARRRPPTSAVDGGMSDNLRPMLYGARYEAEIADRFGGGDAVPRRRQALRVRRHHRPRRRARRPARPATSSSRRSPAPTATRWRTTTTACRARR